VTGTEGRDPGSNPLYVHRERVRFRDLDGLGHVNNAVFLTYMEQARATFFLERAAIRSLAELRMIIARIEIDFRSPVEYGETVDVELRSGRLGTKSFDLAYTLRAGGRVVAEARSVQVAFDYDQGETIPIPEPWRKLLAP
jgi:acyl-CoA thioester hydrolase